MKPESIPGSPRSKLLGAGSRLVLLATIPCLSAAAPSDEVRGRVWDARTTQPIEKARVWTSTSTAFTDREGRFTIPVSSAVEVEISVSAVGYGVTRKLAAPGPGEVDFPLGQDAVKYREALEVQGAVFDHARDMPLSQNLQNIELRNLSSVVADDPLRSVQVLPGVSSGDDFYADFSLRGWGFDKTGLYIDGVLISSPFHTIRNVNDGYSLTILNNDVIDGITLVNGAAPARYGDRVGGALQIETRDGNRETTTLRTSLGAAGVSVLAEGPIGSSGTSFLLGARKSFLDYVVQAIQDQPSFVVGYYDVQAKLSHRTGAHSLSLFVLHGDSDYRDEEPGQGRNDIARADSKTELLSARWRFSPSPKTLLTTGAFLTRETGANRNLPREPLFESESWQSGGRVDLTRELSATHQLQAGLLVRRLSGRVDDTSYSRTGPVIVRSFDRAQWQPGGYVQDGWQSSSRRAAFTAGLRVDRSGASARTVALPRASGLVSLSSRDTMSFAAGSFAQFPSLDQLFGASGNPDLVPEASHHFVIGLEHLLSSASRVRVDLYDQEERHRLDLGGSEIRRVNGRLFLPDQRLLHNSWSGRSKGVEMTVQRRSPNGMTGWLSYAYGRTRLRDSITQSEFDSDHDQKHTVNAYLSYRIGDRTNFSLKYRFGSNTPIAGYFEETSIGFQVSDQRNLLRIPAYSRLDVRANRTFSIRRARLTGYAEVINLLNHSNYRYSGASVQGPSGLTFFDRETTFPFLPAAGITVEW